MPERWRSIPGYEGVYVVSDLGRVLSISGGRGRVEGRILTASRSNRYGHLTVSLSKQNRQRKWAVHRLVLLSFVGPCPPGKEARHYPDQDPTNNRLSNLSWATPLVNQHDRRINKTDNVGERAHQAKLTDAIVREIRKVKNWPYGALTALARRYGVTKSVIRDVKAGKTWRHVK